MMALNHLNLTVTGKQLFGALKTLQMGGESGVNGKKTLGEEEGDE